MISTSTYTFEAAALAALRRGWVPIPLCWPDESGRCACGQHHPERAVGKAPLLGPGYQHVRPDEAIIRQWAKRWPMANVGVLLEPSGLVAIDIDTDDALKTALAQGLPPTVIRSGRMPAYIYARPEGCPTRRICRAGLDILAAGYLVIAGRHRSGAEVYTTDDELAPAPTWAVRLLAEAAEPARATPTEPGEDADAEPPVRLPEYGLKWWRGELVVDKAGREVPASEAAEVDRSATLYHVARCLADAGAARATIVQALAERDRVLGYEKYADRQDGGAREYERIAEKVCRPLELVHVGQNGHRPEPAPGYPLTDLGNAERLAAAHSEHVRYCATWGCWLFYDGKRWRRDDIGEVERRAKATVRAIYHEAGEADDPEHRKAIAAWARQSEAKARIDAMIALARSEPGIAVRPEDFDGSPWLLNVENGTLDLRTGALRPHDPADLITKLAPVEYRPDADCPTFERFLERILPDPEVRSYLQRWAGYCLTGSVREQRLPVWHGSGANGKSTLVGCLLGILGDYGKQTAPDLLVLKQHDEHPTALADLFGARLAASVEVSEGRRLAEALVKQMTGGDRLKARYMRADFFEWTPTHKLVLVANHRPVITGADEAIWRRIDLVPFIVTIPEAERDPDLPDKLKAEYPGILRWAVEGCLAWRQNGLGRPEAVRAASEQYRAEMDTLGAFLSDCCVLGPRYTVAVSELYSAYEQWCTANSEKTVSKRTFTQRLRDRGIGDRKGAKGVRLYQGIALRDEWVAEGGTSSVSLHEDSKKPGDTENLPPSATHSPETVPAEPAEVAAEPVAPDTATALALAERAGWPRLPLRPGVAIAAGEEAWRKWVNWADPADLALARAALDADKE